MRNARALRELAAERGLQVSDARFFILKGSLPYRMDCRQKERISEETWNGAHELLIRYRRFRHHVLEVAPGWKKVGEFTRLDGSVVGVQRSANGKGRTVELVPSSGDKLTRA